MKYDYIEDLNKDELKNECRQLNKERLKYVKLTCKSCKLSFTVDNKYNGVITCPYCSDYVEG